MSFTNMPCFSQGEEGGEPKLISSGNACRLIPSLIREACAQCHVSCCLNSPSSMSSVDEEDESLPNNYFDHKHVIILEIRSRAMKAKARPKDYFFTDRIHWVISPTNGKLLIAPKEEKLDVGEEKASDSSGAGADDQSDVFYSVNSCLSHCSSEKELDYYFSHFCKGSMWEEFLHCEGWPFGLWRKALMLPPLPSSPSDSWTWRKRNLSSAKFCSGA